MTDVVERPILFSAPMVRAILEGKKTQTRRVVKSPVRGREIIFLPDHEILGSDQESWFGPNPDRDDPINWGVENFIEYDPLLLPEFECPYGQPGDRLWVREAFCLKGPEHGDGYFYRASDDVEYIDDGDGYAVLNTDGSNKSPWRPSIHMPRKACRILLEVTSVRVERLQDITAADADAEGVEYADSAIGRCYLDYEHGGFNAMQTAKSSFGSLWRTINDQESWDANPWVWAVEFKKLEHA